MCKEEPLRNWLLLLRWEPDLTRHVQAPRLYEYSQGYGALILLYISTPLSVEAVEDFSGLSNTALGIFRARGT